MTIGEMLDASKAEGERLGRINSLLEMLEELGEISENVGSLIHEADEETLKCWIKLAARSSSLVEYIDKRETVLKEDELHHELEKGYIDVIEGYTKPVGAVFEEIGSSEK